MVDGTRTPSILNSQDLRCLLASKGVYKYDNLPQFCLKLLSQQEMEDLGIPPYAAFWLTQAGQPPTGFKAAMYRDYISQNYIVTFAGTDPEEKADWLENFDQAFGYTKFITQYTKAMQIADAIRPLQGTPITYQGKSVPQEEADHTLNFIFTGHSLGGGLASAASVVANIRAITFNAAGLHKETLFLPNTQTEIYTGSLQRYNNNGDGKIKAYYMNFDMLSNIQDLRSLLPVGEWIPSALGDRICLKSRYDPTINIITTLAGFTSLFTAGLITGYNGYKCHLCDELLYGFLVYRQGGWNGTIIENSLGPL